MSSERTERRFRWLSSLGARVSIFYMLLFLASTAVLFVLASYATERTLEARDESVLRAELERQGQSLRAGGLSNVRGAADRDRVLLVRVTGVDRRTLVRHAPSEAPSNAELNIPVGDSEPILTQVTTEQRVSWTVASRRVDDHVVQVGISEASRAATLSELRTGYAWVLGIAALLGLIGGPILVRRALRPVRDLASTARHVVDSGDLSARVSPHATGDELDDLTVIVNEMLTRNERLVRGMRESLDHVAHDLRTPLTRLRGTAEVALRDESEDAGREALADVIEESDRVLAMLRTLMDISEAETGVLRLERERVDLADIARDVVDLYEHVAEEAGVGLALDVDSNVAVDGDRTRLRQAVANLVDNAVKYTREGGHVTVEARLEGDHAVLVVRDDGEGIAPEALPRIWDRLYRADPSRSERGLGLGLSLVKAIAEAHGGSARAESEVGRGSTFTLELPKAA